MEKKVPFSFIIVIGLMLFALFFGAGNLIFPTLLGQSSGTNFWAANIGFLITGVGLPTLGVIALGVSGKEDLQSLSSRVHPVFGVVFTTVLYLAIGPLFAIPRTGNVSFEIGVKPFLDGGSHLWVSIVFSIIFFGITCFFSLNPARIVDLVGKVLTPIKLTFISILIIAGLLYPIGALQPPTAKYASNALFKGFQEGYLTMDALASFVFGIIVIQAIRSRGATSRKQVITVSIKAACIAAIILSVLYVSLSYISASSVTAFGYLENGGQILARMSSYYFGTSGGIFLGLMITIACLTTSIGLITSCASYFHKLLPRLAYKKLVVGMCIFSAVIANIGLNELIQISVPVLKIIYPLAIVLMILTFCHHLFKGNRLVYQGSMLLVFLVSIPDGLRETPLHLGWLDTFMSGYIPMYTIGMGWVLPAVIGAIGGYVISMERNRAGATDQRNG
ncbi:branched-chain amino acid transport system II carrier protein [Paenibacillus hunanensis]|uniref:branched-chain amino acid transport system II carrier protein n=1 Tax=Paenibacillus hunanensis TaxID=539262 RepID=UPI002026C20A|nr:branched-chain amino acid transport system II carrier protein [Paenibacillus hunanensis]MCL9662249.1 branched-chain amino acid transport system II carrier protein [Paenibacillus hunanensis]